MTNQNLKQDMSKVSCVPTLKLSLQDKLKAITDFDFKGNLKPHAWFNHIRFPNGKPDPIAMDLLADILYWYRPKVIREESTGNVIGIKKKFKADKLQRSVVSLANQFGYSSRQVSEALGRLETLGLIAREYRTIKTELGKIPHVLFIDINALAIINISRLDVPLLSDEEEGDDYFIPLSTEEAKAFAGSSSVLPNVSPSNARGLDIERKTSCTPRATYTEITTKISTADSSRVCNTSNNGNAIAAAAVNDEKNISPIVHYLPTREAESFIAEALTTKQQQAIRKALQALSLSDKVIEEVEVGLLDGQCFSKTGKDFHRKLRAIVTAIKKGSWTCPVGIEAKRHEEKSIHDKKEDTEVKALWAKWGDTINHMKSLKLLMSVSQATSNQFHLESQYKALMRTFADIEKVLVERQPQVDFNTLKQKYQELFYV